MESFAAQEETEDRLGPRRVRPLRRHLPELALGLGCAALVAALLASV